MNGQPDIETLSRDECLALLATVSIGRIGTTVDALPVVLPITFALSDGELVVRTMPGTKLHQATVNSVVALQADQYRGPADPTGWSVLVRALARPIVDAAELDAARQLPLGPWAPAGTYLAMEPTIVSGRRIHPADGPAI